MGGLIAALSGPGVSLEEHVSLASHTTLRVGGPARVLATIEDEAALVGVVRCAVERELPLLVLGRGSNLLVGDDGWPGIVLRLGSGLRGITVDGTSVHCGGAEPMPSVAVHTAQAGLGGFAWGCAVPGTIGGGVRMNAGAHGADMSDSVREARVVDPRTGDVETWDIERLGLTYRHSALPDAAIVTQVTLALEPADPAVVLADIDAIRAWRRANQPINRPSCGSVFTNPDGDSAGRLIDRAGLKGTRVGGAEVSMVHANFIVTRPGALAADVVALIELITDRVEAATGVVLVPEVVRPGAPAEGDRQR
jgi:UDP-N-acetylmuramate dehydrogenase